MVIDFHTHTFPESIAAAALDKMQAAAKIRAFLDGTVSGLSRSMQAANIEIAVNLPVATNIRQPHKLNLAAIAINERSEKTGIISFGAVHPDDPNWKEELRFAASSGIKGVKLHPMYQGVDFDDIRYLRIIGEAASLGLIVIAHSGEDIGIPGPSRCSPRHVLNVLRETGTDKLVLAHMGGWNIWNEVRYELAGAPVYFDTSFSFGKANFHPNYPRSEDELKLGDTELLKDIILSHGTDKILFGSDSPWGDEAQAAEQVKALGFSDADTADILGNNAKKLLRI